MLSKSLKWLLGLVHYIAKFTISRFVISRFECMYIVLTYLKMQFLFLVPRVRFRQQDTKTKNLIYYIILFYIRFTELNHVGQW